MDCTNGILRLFAPDLKARFWPTQNPEEPYFIYRLFGFHWLYPYRGVWLLRFNLALFIERKLNQRHEQGIRRRQVRAFADRGVAARRSAEP